MGQLVATGVAFVGPFRVPVLPPKPEGNDRL